MKRKLCQCENRNVSQNSSTLLLLYTLGCSSIEAVKIFNYAKMDSSQCCIRVKINIYMYMYMYIHM